MHRTFTSHLDLAGLPAPALACHGLSPPQHPEQSEPTEKVKSGHSSTQKPLVAAHLGAKANGSLRPSSSGPTSSLTSSRTPLVLVALLQLHCPPRVPHAHQAHLWLGAFTPAASGLQHLTARRLASSRSSLKYHLPSEAFPGYLDCDRTIFPSGVLITVRHTVSPSPPL